MTTIKFRMTTGSFNSDIQYLNQPPFTSGVRTINFADPVDKARHDRMVALVTQMVEIRFWPSGQRRIREERMSVLRWLNKKLQDASLDHEKELLARQVEATDASIDKLVYELYGLTEEEIAVVEGV
jgi:hypothetical protein